MSHQRARWIWASVFTFIVLGLLSGVFPAFAQTQEIPPQHLEAAQQAFAEGMDYYLWYEGAEPIEVARSCMSQRGLVSRTASSAMYFQIEFNYLAKNEKLFPPYKIWTVVNAMDAKKKEVVQMSTTTQNDQKPTTRVGRGVAAFGSDSILSGDGNVEVSFQGAAPKRGKPSESQDRRLISNTLKIRITCPDGRAFDGEKWATDWSVFVRRLGVEVEKNAWGYADYIYILFGEKDVMWQGKIRMIKPPDPTKPEDESGVWVAMEPVTWFADYPEGGMNCETLDTVKMVPLPSEWATWDKVEVGQSVKFTTKLGNVYRGVRRVYQIGELIGTKGGRRILDEPAK